eukprot:886612-Prorocentrum_minimum.AAC.5
MFRAAPPSANLLGGAGGYGIANEQHTQQHLGTSHPAGFLCEIWQVPATVRAHGPGYVDRQQTAPRAPQGVAVSVIVITIVRWLNMFASYWLLDGVRKGSVHGFETARVTSTAVTRNADV